MSDLYYELLVKKESTGKDKLIKYGLYALTAVAVLAGLFIHPLLLIAVGIEAEAVSQLEKLSAVQTTKVFS